MSAFPKLKISGIGWGDSGQLVDFEQAKYFPYTHDFIITVDDRVVTSFVEMEQMAAKDGFKNKEFLEVRILPVVVGG